jgi:hypothetical protein
MPHWAAPAQNNISNPPPQTANLPGTYLLRTLPIGNLTVCSNTNSLHNARSEPAAVRDPSMDAGDEQETRDVDAGPENTGRFRTYGCGYGSRLPRRASNYFFGSLLKVFPQFLI